MFIQIMHVMPETGVLWCSTKLVFWKTCNFTEKEILRDVFQWILEPFHGTFSGDCFYSNPTLDKIWHICFASFAVCFLIFNLDLVTKSIILNQNEVGVKYYTSIIPPIEGFRKLLLVFKTFNLKLILLIAFSSIHLSEAPLPKHEDMVWYYYIL